MALTVTDSISSTITTLQATTGHYNIVKADKGLREVFHEAGRGLLLVEKALQTAKTQLRGDNLAGDTQSATNALKGCSTKANTSNRIFTAVAQAPETSRLSTYKAAVEREGKGSMVEVLVERMMNDVCALSEKGAITGMEEQVMELRDAVEKLSKMGPSLLEESGNTFNHYGSGNQFNAVGGTQNITHGNGPQFPGATFPGSVRFS